MKNQNAISMVNNLIETSKDGEKGFLTAAQHAKAPQLKSLLTEYSAECARSVRELQECVTMLGGKAETTGTATAAVHRGWMNLKASVSENDDAAILDECERGEDHAKAQYSKALKAADLSPDVRSLLQRQYEGTLRHHDRIRDLRNRAAQTA